MKKIAFFFLFSFVLVFQSQAQNQDSLTLLQVMEKINTLQQNQATLLQLQQQRSQDSLTISLLRDSLGINNHRVNDLESDINRYKNSLEAQEAIVKDVTRRVEITDEARYRLIKSNLQVSAELFELLNDKLNTLYAISQVQSYRTMLATLNNPADESLGFSYSKKVSELVNEKLPLKKDKGRILEIASTFIQNPTVQGVTSAVPILNMSSSLFSFIAGIAANRKEVSTKNVAEFKQELDKYTAYYAKMNHANTTFIGNINNYQVQTTSLHNKLEEFVVRSLGASGVEIKPREESDASHAGEYLSNVVFKSYNQRFIQNYLNDLEKRYTKLSKTNYARILNENKELTELNRRVSDVSYFSKEFEYLYGQYISMLEENSKALVLILEEAKRNNLSEDESKISKQIEVLKGKKSEAIRGIKTAINIGKIKDVVERLNAYEGGF